MKDVWIELIRSGVPPTTETEAPPCGNPAADTACEIVDKVWYRGSPFVSLQAKQFQYAGSMFLQEDGNVLSDHNPVLVDFEWTASEDLGVSDTFGGETGGNWFNDVDTWAGLDNGTVSSITLRGASRLDAISLALSSGQSFSHGGGGGTATTLALNPGETLVGATLCQGNKDGKEGKRRIFYAGITTSEGRSVEAGNKTSDCVTRIAKEGWAIVGFLGRAGDEVDQVGVIYGKIQ